MQVRIRSHLAPTDRWKHQTLFAWAFLVLHREEYRRRYFVALAPGGFRFWQLECRMEHHSFYSCTVLLHHQSRSIIWKWIKIWKSFKINLRFWERDFHPTLYFLVSNPDGRSQGLHVYILKSWLIELQNVLTEEGGGFGVSWDGNTECRLGRIP